MHHPEYHDPVINIEETADIDPWSDEGIALKRFEAARDRAREAAKAQRQALNALLEHEPARKTVIEDEGDRDARRRELEAAVLEAAERKAAATRRAQRAREDFDRAMAERQARRAERVD
jgi:BCCT family betaine/carnitine transporter